MNILFTICGRAGSKGIKNKNIRDFLGYPLLLYTLSALDLYLSEHEEVSYDIVGNTDSEELIAIFDNNKLRKVDIIRRNESLAGDKVAKVDVILDCLIQMENKANKVYDMVVDLDITSPLRTADDIANLIDKKIKTDCDVVFSVTDSRRNPYFNMVMKTDKGYQRVIKSNYVTRQEAPEIFDMNASLYAYAPSHLKAGKSIFNGYCEVITMMDTGVLDLDHESDFELMTVIANFLFSKFEKFNEVRENIVKNM